MLLAEEDEVKKEAFEFYYELAGLHEDLSENQKCVENWLDCSRGNAKNKVNAIRTRDLL